MNSKSTTTISRKASSISRPSGFQLINLAGGGGDGGLQLRDGPLGFLVRVPEEIELKKRAPTG